MDYVWNYLCWLINLFVLCIKFKIIYVGQIFLKVNKNYIILYLYFKFDFEFDFFDYVFIFYVWFGNIYGFIYFFLYFIILFVYFVKNSLEKFLVIS